MKKSIHKKVYSIALITAVILAINLSFASDQIPAPPQDHPIALIGGTIHTISNGILYGGTILFEDGKITKIGTNIDLPSGTERIDITGMHVYPSLISTNSNIGLVEINAVQATRDYAERGDINPNVRAEAAINPDSEMMPVARANGVALALSIPSGGIISGRSALVMMDGWTWESMTLKSSVGLHVSWPSMGTQRGRFFRRAQSSPEEQKKRREEQLNKIKNAFAEARAYMVAKEAEGKKGIPHHDSDLRWEAMIPFLKGEASVFIRANEIRQIQSAVDWATSENLKMVLFGGRDAWRVTDLLVENNIPVILDAIQVSPMRRWEAYDAPLTNAKKLLDAGVQFCIAGGGSAANQRNLPYHAAMAAAFGLPKEEALKAITLSPAQILGVADQVGSLDEGKDATLFVANGDPLEIMTNVTMEFIQGRRIDLSSKHTQLYEKYRTKYKQMNLIQEKIAAK